MVIVSRLWPISIKPPGGYKVRYGGGDKMVLMLYHDDNDPVTVYNVIKVTVDNSRTLVATMKHGVHINLLSYRHGIDYQRFTIQLD